VSPIIGGKVRLSMKSIKSTRKISLKERYDTGDSFFEGLDYIDEENNSSESNEFKDYD